MTPGAALQYGMGKQYPGEQLPRWALSAHWRRDGEGVWLEPDLLADPDRSAGPPGVTPEFVPTLDSWTMKSSSPRL